MHGLHKLNLFINCVFLGNNTEQPIRLEGVRCKNWNLPSKMLSSSKIHRRHILYVLGETQMKNIYFPLTLHIVCSDTHGGSVCGRPGRSREGRMPGTGGCLGPAGPDGSHRTGNPICWNRWHRMTGRLQDEEEKGGRDPDRQSFEILISVLVSHLSLWQQDS